MEGAQCGDVYGNARFVTGGMIGADWVETDPYLTEKLIASPSHLVLARWCLLFFSILLAVQSCDMLFLHDAHVNPRPRHACLMGLVTRVDLQVKRTIQKGRWFKWNEAGAFCQGRMCLYLQYRFFVHVFIVIVDNQEDIYRFLINFYAAAMYDEWIRLFFSISLRLMHPVLSGLKFGKLLHPWKRWWKMGKWIDMAMIKMMNAYVFTSLPSCAQPDDTRIYNSIYLFI